MRSIITDSRPLPIRLAEAELDLRLDRRRLLEIERRIFEAPDDDDLEELHFERDEALRQVDWSRLRFHLLHDETTEHLVPEELRLTARHAA